MQALVNEAKGMIGNKIVMNFVREEALKKVASEMQAMGYSCTYKAVELLSYRYPNIADRVNEYVSIGIIACMTVKHDKH